MLMDFSNPKPQQTCQGQTPEDLDNNPMLFPHSQAIESEHLRMRLHHLTRELPAA